MTRCAIYTRKSHEEGLDQAFNSLDAQREAGLDYIRSQRHEGWEAHKERYDDGGCSGGHMRRPALRRLLEDIERGGIDVVVVYKVDRLSRSLHDFAQMMRLFDEHKVSFVSVTQQFNTTTSMGRLTLNMLLSFAQFEREVTGERIRDKLAATKKKGMWVGGQPPLGYRLEERQLVIIPEEAQLVRRIFRERLAHPSLVELAQQLDEEGFTTKRWRSRGGNGHGGRRLTPKYLYRILTHPLYIGRIVHRERTWPGRHEPIVDQQLWDRVQRTLETQHRQTRYRWDHPHLLKGKLRTHEGFAMSPGAMHRPTGKEGEKRLVRYYVSQKAIRQGYKHCAIKTINARDLDDLVRALALDHLRRHESSDDVGKQESQVRDHWLRAIIHRVRLAPDRLTIDLDRSQIEACKGHDWSTPDKKQASGSTPTGLYQPQAERRGDHEILTLDIQIKRLDGRRMLLSPQGHDLFMPAEPEPRDHIVRAIGQAYHWRQTLTRTGASISTLARELGISQSRLHKLLPLTHLAPDILKRSLTGHLPPSITLDDLLHAADHLDWHAQRMDLNLEQTSRSGR